jgi:glycogen debranching enzyme
MTARPPPHADPPLVAECSARATALLRRNVCPAGVLAATPLPAARTRGYAAIFGRDAAICALGMAVAPDAVLQREAATGLLTLARHQAKNGQIPKFVDTAGNEADFWYLGCIDATLWWLIAVAALDRRHPQDRLAARLARNVERALVWLSCQEHQRFGLLQQNEASDWADIMPRSGFVLYTNALWYVVKRLHRLPGAAETHRNFNQLFHPFGGAPAEYRRARLLVHYARHRARQRDLYFSFVNFSFCGDEGDVFGNVLAVLAGLADEAATHRIIQAAMRARVNDPYPVRVVFRPILEESVFWRPYMSRHRQNFAWQYHNGGIWPFVGAFWAIALAQAGLRAEAEAELVKVAQANALADWRFTEWLHGRTHAPLGMAGQSWNAATFLLAHYLLHSRTPLFPASRRRTEAE